MLIDSHCHLNFPELAPIEQTVARAHEAGVKIMQTICTRMRDVPTLYDIIDQHESVYASVGVHPNNVEEEEIEVTAAALVEAAAHPKVIGLGETGLDYYRKTSDAKKQDRAFREHIEASRQTRLPVIVHTRDADDATLAVIKEEMHRGAFPGLIHCFGASEAFAREVLELGFYISLSGILTFKNAKSLQEIATALPLNRLLVETDAPYLAPMPHRGKVNEPAFTRHTAEYLATLKNLPFEEVAAATTENFLRLFTKAKLGS